MDVNTLLENKNNIEKLSSGLTLQDIDFLVDMLNEKNDEIRYNSFLALRQRSRISSDIYPYWDTFASKLNDSNSYQRSIGLILISENIRWDKEANFNDIFEDYMRRCNDEKFITSRQAIQSISNWAAFASDELLNKTANRLKALNIEKIKETQRKLILTDILNALIMLHKANPKIEIYEYFNMALTGEILDKKAKKQFESMLKS